MGSNESSKPSSQALPVTGDYVIINKESQKALDFNYGAARQISYQHPRIFVWPTVTTAPNHNWHVEKRLETADTQNLHTNTSNNNTHYIIKTTTTTGIDLALNGSIAPHVPQKDIQHPAPFLSQIDDPSVEWILKPVACMNTYMIMNAENGMILDGNTLAIEQEDHTHQTPFLKPFSEFDVNNSSCHWIFKPSIFTMSNNGSQTSLSHKLSLIVNKATGMALDCNVNAADQVCPSHKRIFMWTPTKDAPNHLFSLRKVSSDGEYLILASNGMALDGNTSPHVPQMDHNYPCPFLYEPNPHAPNHRWRFIPAPNDPNTFFILNCASGKVLDANVFAIQQKDEIHRSPFLSEMYESSESQMWNIIDATTQTSSSPKLSKKQRDEVECEPIDPSTLVDAPSFHEYELDAIRSFYDRQGFVLIKSLLSEKEVELVKETFDKINKTRPITLEEANGDTLSMYPRVMMPHRSNEVAKQILLHPKVIKFIEMALGEECRAAQSMFYFKPPFAKGQSLHQDNFYLKVDPGNCIAGWIAIDDCDEGNGGMYLVPDTKDYDIQCPGTANPEVSFAQAYVPIPNRQQPLLARMKAGDVLLFNGNVIHGSGPNPSNTRFRRSFIGHYVPSSATTISRFYLPLVDSRSGEDVFIRSSSNGGPCE